MKKLYANEYGELELETVGALCEVSAVSSRNVPVELYASPDIAAKIALISDNRGIQMCYVSKAKKFYIVYHNSASYVYLCRIRKLVYRGGCDPYREIERVHAQQLGNCVV